MKTLIIFFPSVESGGVEKNFYYLLHYFSKKFEKIIVITSSRVNKKQFPKKINFLNINSIFWFNRNRLIKSIICFFFRLKSLFSKRKNYFILSIKYFFNYSF